MGVSFDDISQFCHGCLLLQDVTILTEKDLASVQDAVWDGRAKWYNIGLQLGLIAGTLDAIRQTNNNHTDDCFTTILKEWLRRGDLQPSWISLTRSLRARSVGLGHLAEQLPNTDPSNQT